MFMSGASDRSKHSLSPQAVMKFANQKWEPEKRKQNNNTGVSN